MEPARIITRYHRRTQRLGFLKPLLWKASRSATHNLSTLGAEFLASVSQKVTVPLAPDLELYIRKVLTDSIHKNLRAAMQGPILPQEITMEIQDVFLADRELPSHQGRLVHADWDKYPTLPVELGLLRTGTFSLLVRGQSFLSLVGEEEQQAFAKQGNFEKNPLKLDLSQSMFLLFCFLEKDGDVLRGLYEILLSENEPFPESKAGDNLADVYRAVAIKAKSRISGGQDLKTIEKIMNSADKIAAWKGKEAKGGGARDEAATIRLEPFVDMGMLSKPDPFVYRYAITDTTRFFFQQLIAASDVDQFLTQDFFRSISAALGLNQKHDCSAQTVIPAVAKAYSILKSPLGYAPILDICLLAGIHSIVGQSGYFEITEAMNELKQLQREEPQLVRFNVDRRGVLTVVKFNGDPMIHLKDHIKS